MTRNWEVFTGKNGLGRRVPGRGRRHGPSLLTASEIVRLRDDIKLTFAAIAQQAGVTSQAVSQRYKTAKHNAALRTQGEGK